MKKTTKLLIAGILTTGVCFNLQAIEDNPYDYSEHRATINDAKLQMPRDNSDNSVDICERSECDSLWGTDFRDNVWVDTEDRDRMYVHTDSVKVTKWRAEWRYLDSFGKNDNQSMKTVFKRITGGTDARFTVAQLHVEGADGPPARIEYDDGQFQVEFREEDGDSNDVEFTEEYLSGRGGTKTVTMTLMGDNLNILHKGNTTTYDLSKWDENGDVFYWKAGVYLQQGDNVKMRFTYIRW